ncbi:hypothetical protein [Pseudofrankia sp. BMG5.36]|uniref:hypothetical protein n=1 Tax=Pseudofrankia sp. BMG5.36 TaxID=1834512 RepID=UPI0008D9898E|nr:hypothetical protein [Pseudofrankia sp. BMG5.36]OHV43576.1 hypothetical protein BCD48_27770 [Pseudofrankia sp. BMG5.36]
MDNAITPERQALLPQLTSGSTVATLAIADGPGCWDESAVRTTATPHKDGYLVSAVKRWVWEDDSHLFLRRVQSNRMPYGTPEWHSDRLGDVVGVAA